MDASKHRDTKYEVVFVHQGPNAFGVEVVERGVHGSRPMRLELHQDLFTDEEMAKIHEALGILEIAFEVAHGDHEKALGIGADMPRKAVHDLVKQAEAARLAKLQAEAEMAAARAATKLLEEEAAKHRAAMAANEEAGRQG